MGVRYLGPARNEPCAMGDVDVDDQFSVSARYRDKSAVHIGAPRTRGILPSRSRIADSVSYTHLDVYKRQADDKPV